MSITIQYNKDDIIELIKKDLQSKGYQATDILINMTKEMVGFRTDEHTETVFKGFNAIVNKLD